MFSIESEDELKFEKSDKEKVSLVSHSLKPISQSSKTSMLIGILTSTLAGMIIFLTLASVILGIYFAIFYKIDFKYQPPKTGSVINIEIISTSEGSRSRLLEDNNSETNETIINYTFIVLDSTSESMEVIAAPGIVTEIEIKRLRSLSDDTETIDNLPFFIAQLNFKKGEIQSLKKPQNTTESDSQKVVSALSMALINLQGEEKARKGKGKEKSNADDCETYGEALYCPSFSSEINEDYEILKATYNGISSNGNRRLSNENPLLENTNITLEKISHINMKTGILEKSKVQGSVSMNLFENENITNQSEYTVNTNLTANFMNSNFSMSQKDAKDLKKALELSIIYEEANLNTTQEFMVDGNYSDDDTIINPPEERQLSLENHGRNLIYSYQEEVFLFRIIGVDIFLRFKILENAGGNFESSFILRFGQVFDIKSSSQINSNDLMRKIRKVMNLKNILEDGVNNIKFLISDYSNYTVGVFETQILGEFTKLQSFLEKADTNFTNALNDMDIETENFANAVKTKTDGFKDYINSQVLQTNNSMNNLISNSKALNNSISDSKILIELYEMELRETNNEIDSLNNVQIPFLNKEINITLSKLQENTQNYSEYTKLKQKYENAETQVNDQISNELQVIKTINSFEETIVNEKDILEKEINSTENYINYELKELKRNIKTNIDDLNEKIKIIDQRIEVEVIQSTKEKKENIEGLKKSNADLDNRLSFATEDQVALFLEIKELIQTMIDDLENQLNVEIPQLSTDLNAKKTQYLEEIDLQFVIAEKKYNNQSKYWNDNFESYKNEINNNKQIIQSIKLQLSEEKQQLETNLSLINTEILSQREDIVPFYEILASQLILQEKSVDKGVDKVTEVENKLDDVLDYIDTACEDIKFQSLKSKEDIENEVNDLRTQANQNLLNLDNRIQLEVIDARNQIEAEIAIKQTSLNQIVDNAEKVILQGEIDKLNESLIEINNLEQELLAQKSDIENNIEEMEIPYLYVLVQGTKEYKEKLLQTENLLKLVSLQELNLTISDSITEKYTIKQDLLNIKNTRIIPLITNAEGIAITLQNYVNATEDDIKNVTSQIYQLGNLTLCIELEIANTSANISNLENSLLITTESIEELKPSLINITSIQNSINDGTYNWTTFFDSNNLTSTKQIIENSVILQIDNTYNLAVAMINATSEILNRFNSTSKEFIDKSYIITFAMQNSSNNLANLDEAERVTSGTKVFDFTEFNKTVDLIKNKFDTIKNEFNSTANNATNYTAENLKEVDRISNQTYWNQKLDKSINSFKAIENQFNINLDYGNVKDVALNKLKNLFTDQINNEINYLNICDNLTAITSNFTNSSLSSIIFSQASTNKLIPYFGLLGENSTNLLSRTLNFNIHFPGISTPIGFIIPVANLKYDENIFFKSIMSNLRKGIQFVPKGTLVITSGIEWNFFLGAVGFGISMINSNSFLVEFGLSFTESLLYSKSSYSCSQNSLVGVYLRWLRIEWRKACWGGWIRICIWYPVTSYSDPNYIISDSVNSKIVNRVISVKTQNIY
ncbi:hypothetical protein SteCoe_6294 [Stentor coeruleus]|uniref:Uncharacterized protein n=1 Tax=Stentor coeruleus TaxID=5963 RepID=A0A1R2CQG9_9CILI|nr:hypothetical protein SteCoe_6294 [Stentor coeruleus]